MPYTPTGSELDTNGTTPVTVVASPSASEQIVVGDNAISVFNSDTANATVSIIKNKGGSSYIIERVVLAPDETLTNGARVILDATDESITVVLAGAITTNELEITAAYGVLS